MTISVAIGENTVLKAGLLHASKTELLFPPRLIPKLKHLRGEEWRKLVEYIASLSETHPDSLAFSLMMIRLNGCLKCESGTYKFMRGCALCAEQTVVRFKGTDAALLQLFRQAKEDIDVYLGEQRLDKAA